MAKLSLNFRKSSIPPIFVRNPRWASPTRAWLVFLYWLISIILLLLKKIHFKGSLTWVWFGSDYWIRLKLMNSIFFYKNYKSCMKWMINKKFVFMFRILPSFQYVLSSAAKGGWCKTNSIVYSILNYTILLYIEPVVYR